jgi:phenylpropionate dioxygenase-like ring-hydroxylating dioxygenase large terminal subunit
MTSFEDQAVLTQVGAASPMGALMRQYWLPAAMSSELTADGDPLRLMILGERLIAFRDTSGRVGIFDHRCPHRCASLFFGRNEAGGLRCVYHGWKFDADGNCLEMANVPPHQDFRHKVRAKAYKAAERAGVVWVYMGDAAAAPELPAIEATMGDERDTVVCFIQRACSYLPALEGSIDTSHAGILHGPARRDASGSTDVERIIVANRHPEYKMAETPYGTAYGAYRPAAAGTLNWRVAHFLFPFWTLAPTGPIEGQVTARAWVPMDDSHTMSVYFARRSTLHVSNLATLGGGVAEFGDFLPNTSDWHGRWRPRAAMANDYFVDRRKQRSESFTGIDGVLLQDQMITESIGVSDMQHEHLAASDAMIALTRRRLLKAATELAAEGMRPPAADRPEDYLLARGGFFEAAENRDWLDVYRQRLAAARAA